jgi:L-lactate dehydrogenase
MTPHSITVIGTGNVGSSLAYELRHLQIDSAISLYDVDAKMLEAQYLDLSQSMNGVSSNSHYQKIDSLKEITNQNIVCITAGVAQKKGQTRLQLERTNYEIVRSILHTVIPNNTQATFIILTNPVDVILNSFYSDSENQVFAEYFNQILSTGTLLDTHRLYAELDIRPDPYNYSKYPMILGEHGDSQALYNPTKQLISSNTTAFVKQSAYTIIQGKGYTNFAIATATKKLIDILLTKKNSILPLSTYQSFVSTRFETALSLPVIMVDGRIHSIDSNFDNESIKKLVRDSIDVISSHTR